MNGFLKNAFVVCVAFILCFAGYASSLEFSSEPPAIAVWYEDWGLIPKVEGPQFIAAVWKNGNTLWSTNTVREGVPYYYGKTSVDVGTLLDSFQDKGYFSMA